MGEGSSMSMNAPEVSAGFYSVNAEILDSTSFSGNLGWAPSWGR